MEAPGQVPDSINCHACGSLLELAGQTGFTHIECPRCGALSVVPLRYGDFLLLAPLGIGGMGTVYKAIDLTLTRYLAMKILRKKLAANPRFIESFCREARAAAAVNHPNIAQVYSFGERDGQYYLAMELLERGSLDDRISKLGKLPEKEVLEIGLQIASGLRAAHQRGLLHRDIKPGNILFNEENTPKLVDFGLARAQQGTEPVTEPVWGTPYYVAPEKLRGQGEDHRSDIYSLGATLFHALAGRPPFEAPTAGEVVVKHALQPAYSLKTYAPTVHDFTAHLIARMLAKNPAERYDSYDELIGDLNGALAAVKAAESSRAVVAATGERVSLGSLLASAAALVGVCGLIGWLVWANRATIFRRESPPPHAPRTVEPAAEPAPVAPAAQEVDFTEEAPWVKAFNVATLQLAQGRYHDALLGYDSALLAVGRARPKHRQWIQFFQVLTLFAADRPGEAHRILMGGVDPTVTPKMPAEITTGNFVDVLWRLVLGTMPPAEVQAALPKMPAWAAALTHLAMGFKHLQAAQFERAAESFRAYHRMERDPARAWAFNLQPLADRLARQSDAAVKTLGEIDALQQAGRLEEALAVLRAAATNSPLAALRTVLAARETELQRAAEQQREQAERQQREREQLQQQREAEEARLLRELEPAVSVLWQQYDFAQAVSQYEALAGQLQTEAGKRQLEARLAVARWLAEFKAQLVRDIRRRPYEGADLRTRTQSALPGRLVGATEQQLVFATPHGEIVVDWRDVAPAALARLAEFYAAAQASAEAAGVRAGRHMALAVFCSQFGLPQSVRLHLGEALRLQPQLQQQAQLLFPR